MDVIEMLSELEEIIEKGFEIPVIKNLYRQGKGYVSYQ